jgi:hypothetical protein
MLLWPAVAALGFLALTGVVIALGTSSTARYDFERNRAHEPQPEALARSAAPRAEENRSAFRRGGGAPRGSRPRRAAARQHSPARGAAAVATHPAGRRLGVGEPATGWWLVDLPDDDGAAPRVVAGPFADRLDADWGALSSGWDAARVRAVYGVRTVAGAVLPKPAPHEGTWMLELGQQLTRLTEDWFDLVSDTDPLTTLVVEVAEALIEAGLPLHDCSGPGTVGGVCLTPVPQSGGILVSWHGHDRVTLEHLHGAELDEAVRQTMGAAIADVLAQRGFGVEPLGWSGGHLVTAGGHGGLL